MTEKTQVYKCGVCGNIVTVLHAGGGTLVCCGQDMNLLDPNTTDAAQEKHVPVIERDGGKIKVKVGSAPHPMEESHWIEWIQLIAGEDAYRTFLNPGDAAEAVFLTDAEKVSAREYCNVHGLWKKE